MYNFNHIVLVDYVLLLIESNRVLVFVFNSYNSFLLSFKLSLIHNFIPYFVIIYFVFSYRSRLLFRVRVIKLKSVSSYKYLMRITSPTHLLGVEVGDSSDFPIVLINLHDSCVSYSIYTIFYSC